MTRTDPQDAPDLARRAVAIFERLGVPTFLARAWLVLGNTYVGLEQPREANEACERALALARQCGDLTCQAGALNLLGWFEPDQAKAVKLRQQALAAYTAAGNVHGRAIIIGNLGSMAVSMGLYRQARRQLAEADAMHRRMGNQSALAVNSGNLFEAELRMGNLEAARVAGAEAAEIVRARKFRRFAGWPSGYLGRLALAEGRFAEAVRLYERACEEQGPHNDGVLMALESDLAHAFLKAGEPVKALAATRRAVALHEAKGLAWLDGMDPPVLWWRHAQALAANRRHAEAASALTRAYGLLVDHNAQLGDEGLRRNALNKVEETRELLAAWVSHARRRRLSKAKREAHLAGKVNLSEAFERLVETGLRLNEIRSEAELTEFLVDEVTELSGAERVLLVLEGEGGPQIAGSLLPPGESEAALVEHVGPWLEEARRTRSAALRHLPEEAASIDQKSSLVVPLFAQRELLGFIYADIDGLYGRFHDGDVQLLGMLAAQAALTLANVRFAAGLERKVAERTAELEQRASELTIINSIQQGMAGSLEFQAIVDLVGDKLREVLQTRGHRHPPGSIRRPACSIFCTSTSTASGCRSRRRRSWPAVRSTRCARPALRSCTTRQPSSTLRASAVVPGTDRALSVVFVPIVSGDRVTGVLLLENHEREHAYGEAEIRLLTTVASSMGVALENARLFDETQRLLKETEQRAAEMAVINSIQQGIAGELSFQAIVDLVGDKLREVLKTGDIGIRWHDRGPTCCTTSTSTSTAQRLAHPAVDIAPGGPWETMVQTAPAAWSATRWPSMQARGLKLVPGTDQELSLVRVPIIGSDRVLGYLGVENFEREHAFGESELRLLTTVAASMGVALENARLFEEIQRRTRESAALAEVGRDISSTLDLPTVMDRIARHARELLQADNSAIFLPEGSADVGAQSFRAIVAEGDHRGAVEGHVDPIRRRHHRQHHRQRPRRVRQRRRPRPARRADCRHAPGERRAADGGAAARGQDGEGRDGGLAQGGPAVPGHRAGIPRRPVAGRRGGDGERAPLRRSAAARGRARHGQHGVARARGQARPVGADRARRRADPRTVQARHRLRRAARSRRPT